jgi:1,4-alpha-glucan branching enzyme
MAARGGSNRKRVVFHFTGEPGSGVYVAGSFNDWSVDKSHLKDKTGKGDYALTILLPPGRYEYKFVVNGVWCVDPQCADWVPNALGSLNSVVVVA